MTEASDSGGQTFLFLRPRQLAEAFSFPQTDRSWYWKLPYVTLEEFLSSSLDIDGVSSVLSVGSAGERWGIGNVEYEEDEWRERIAVLMKRALTILCLIGASPACKFENYLIMRTSEILGKTIFIIPPQSSYDRGKGSGYASATDYYKEIQEIYSEAGVSLPTLDEMASGILFTISPTDLRVGTAMPWPEVQVRVRRLLSDRIFTVRALRSGDLLAMIRKVL